MRFEIRVGTRYRGRGQNRVSRLGWVGVETEFLDGGRDRGDEVKFWDDNQGWVSEPRSASRFKTRSRSGFEMEVRSDFRTKVGIKIRDEGQGLGLGSDHGMGGRDWVSRSGFKMGVGFQDWGRGRVRGSGSRSSFKNRGRVRDLVLGTEGRDRGRVSGRESMSSFNIVVGVRSQDGGFGVGSWDGTCVGFGARVGVRVSCRSTLCVGAVSSTSMFFYFFASLHRVPSSLITIRHWGVDKPRWMFAEDTQKKQSNPSRVQGRSLGTPLFWGCWDPPL
ncbi:hypothetical protein TIFTF001_035009 [Ficus carica]|uniref:Uncharacterized protein n=1 Tax=Ficus carica TaxID=3494 RepID=A0AA88E4S5_FICCA|nr:hypothetical protein TIFTF001_035009 [Ficus carica]